MEKETTEGTEAPQSRPDTVKSVPPVKCRKRLKTWICRSWHGWLWKPLVTSIISGLVSSGLIALLVLNTSAVRAFRQEQKNRLAGAQIEHERAVRALAVLRRPLEMNRDRLKRIIAGVPNGKIPFISDLECTVWGMVKDDIRGLGNLDLGGTLALYFWQLDNLGRLLDKYYELHKGPVSVLVAASSPGLEEDKNVLSTSIVDRATLLLELTEELLSMLPAGGPPQAP
jgi:hypothetical protein